MAENPLIYQRSLALVISERLNEALSTNPLTEVEKKGSRS